jgi:hypothetical protein
MSCGLLRMWINCSQLSTSPPGDLPVQVRTMGESQSSRKSEYSIVVYSRVDVPIPVFAGSIESHG